MVVVKRATKVQNAEDECESERRSERKLRDCRPSFGLSRNKCYSACCTKISRGTKKESKYSPAHEGSGARGLAAKAFQWGSQSAPGGEPSAQVQISGNTVVTTAGVNPWAS